MLLIMRSAIIPGKGEAGCLRLAGVGKKWYHGIVNLTRLSFVWVSQTKVAVSWELSFQRLDFDVNFPNISCTDRAGKVSRKTTDPGLSFASDITSFHCIRGNFFGSFALNSKRKGLAYIFRSESNKV